MAKPWLSHRFSNDEMRVWALSVWRARAECVRSLPAGVGVPGEPCAHAHRGHHGGHGAAGDGTEVAGSVLGAVSPSLSLLQ